MHREAATAAQWWADQVLKAQPGMADQIGAEVDSPLRSPLASMVFALSAADNRADNPTQVEAFRDALATRIEQSLAGYPQCTIGVDYHPDAILGDACDEVGMSYGMSTFPLKTVMWIAAGSVRVSKGYGAPVADVPLTAEPAPK